MTFKCYFGMNELRSDANSILAERARIIPKTVRRVSHHTDCVIHESSLRLEGRNSCEITWLISLYVYLEASVGLRQLQICKEWGDVVLNVKQNASNLAGFLPRGQLPVLVSTAGSILTLLLDLRNVMTKCKYASVISGSLSASSTVRMFTTAGAAENRRRASRLMGPMLGSLLSSSEAADAAEIEKH